MKDWLCIKYPEPLRKKKCLA